MDFTLTLMIGGGLFLLGIPWTWGAFKDRARFTQRLSTMQLVEGEVSRMRKEESYDHTSDLGVTQHYEIPMVEYSVNKIRYIIPVRKDLNKGDKVLVAYNPQVPSDAMLAESDSRYVMASGSVLLAVGASLMVLSLLGYQVLD